MSKCPSQNNNGIDNDDEGSGNKDDYDDNANGGGKCSPKMSNNIMRVCQALDCINL